MQVENMAKIVHFAEVLRRNWKKSTLLFVLTAYGASYGIAKYKTFEMMRVYCKEAKAFGEKVVPGLQKPKHVTVILNPEANNKKANAQFEKFAAPLLHLAGFKVSIFQTEKTKQAQDLMKVMSNTDAVLVAGGNGTLHEVITGLLRRPNCEEENLPLGIIPVGKTNTVANHLFGSKSSSQAQLMAEAAMAVIREETVYLDVMKVKFFDEEQPVFAACCFEQGAFAEIEPNVQKYWYLGALKDKFTYFINSFKNHDPVNYKKLLYVAPCDGCSRCYIPPKMKDKSNQIGRWWSSFIPKKADVRISTVPEITKVLNEECGTYLPLESTFSNFSILTSAYDQNQKSARSWLWIKLHLKNLSLMQFFVSGLNHRESKLQNSSLCTIVNARAIKIENEENLEQLCFIDNEKYKMTSCDITLIPKQVMVYG